MISYNWRENYQILFCQKTETLAQGLLVRISNRDALVHTTAFLRLFT